MYEVLGQLWLKRSKKQSLEESWGDQMTPLPKRKTSKARHGERRSHLSVNLPATQPCSKCHSLKVSHTVCPTCGTYAGEEVTKGKAKKK